MAKFRVTGINRQTGTDILIVVDAASEQEVLIQAGEMGIVVRNVTPLGGNTATTGAPATAAHPEASDTASAIIPYKNPPALIAYYIGLLAFCMSCIPIIGAVVGCTSLVLGIIGLRKRKADPRIHGSVHAWIGIVLGAFAILLSIGITVVIIRPWQIYSGFRGFAASLQASGFPTG